MNFRYECSNCSRSSITYSSYQGEWVDTSKQGVRCKYCNCSVSKLTVSAKGSFTIVSYWKRLINAILNRGE